MHNMTEDLDAQRLKDIEAVIASAMSATGIRGFNARCDAHVACPRGNDSGFPNSSTNMLVFIAKENENA